MRSLFALSIIAFAVALSGCGAVFKEDREWQPAEWDPAQVSISCSDPARCPDHQGVLFSYRPSGRGWEIERCTASLYERSRVLTVGHCRPKRAAKTYFLTVPAAGRPSELIAASYEAGEGRGNADYASFRLAREVVGRSFLRPVDSIPRDPSRMVALVVNGQLARLRLDAQNCRNISNRVQLETVSASPEMFVLQDCAIVKGNSGGAVVRVDDLNAAYGVVSSTALDITSVPQLEARIKTYGIADWAHITNLRCISLPGWPRLTPSCAATTPITLVQ